MIQVTLSYLIMAIELHIHVCSAKKKRQYNFSYYSLIKIFFRKYLKGKCETELSNNSPSSYNMNIFSKES